SWRGGGIGRVEEQNGKAKDEIEFALVPAVGSGDNVDTPRLRAFGSSIPASTRSDISFSTGQLRPAADFGLRHERSRYPEQRIARAGCPSRVARAARVVSPCRKQVPNADRKGRRRPVAPGWYDPVPGRCAARRNSWQNQSRGRSGSGPIPRVRGGP